MVWDVLFEDVVFIVEQFDLMLIIFRCIFRQQNRVNVFVNMLFEYWKCVFFYVFMDYIIQQMDECFLGVEVRYQGFFFLLFRFQSLNDVKFDVIFNVFKIDILGDFNFFKREVERWKMKWEMSLIKFILIVEMFEDSNKVFYLVIYVIFLDLLIMLVVMVIVERLFSVFKCVKIYLCFIMN